MARRGRVAHHVLEDARDVDEEVPGGGAVEVPLVERVALPRIELVVYVHVRRGENVRHVAVQDADPHLEDVADGAAQPRAVHELVVALLVGHHVRRPHHAPAEAHPREVVRRAQPPRQRAVSQLVPEHGAEGSGDGDEGEERGGGVVGQVRLRVHVARRERAQRRRRVEPSVDRKQRVLAAEVERLALYDDGYRPEDEEVGREEHSA